MRIRFHRRCLVLFTFIILVLLYIVYVVNDYFHTKEINRSSIQCYHEKGPSLPDIDSDPPEPGRSLFFIESSCDSYFGGKIGLTARQACAVESAAKTNPNYGVYLLFASPGTIKFENTESDRILRAMMEYDNVKVRHVDYEKYLKGTPVENLYQEGILEKSLYPKWHAGDVYRYLTLWKYGGIYLDLDVVVLKSLEELPPNFAGSESSRWVAAGAIGFDHVGPGHDLALRCVEDLRLNFRGHVWGNNGPGVMERLLVSICNATYAKDMLNRHCGGFKVYPRSAFYPVLPWDWDLYFAEDKAEEVDLMTRESYAIHVWNKKSAGVKLKTTSKASYAEFARKFCPKVFKECDDFF